MGIVNILGFLVIITCISLKCKRQIQELIPLSLSALLLVLYVLSLFQRLTYINYIFLTALLLGVFYLFYEFRKRSYNFMDLKSYIFTPGAFTSLIAILLLVLVLWNRSYFHQFDEFHHWATEVKSIWEFNGLVGADRHTSLAFGDYPVGMQLIQWWFLNLRGQLDYQMVYIGTFIFNFSFLFPLLSALKTKKVYLYPLIAVFVITAVSIVNITIYYQPLSPDGTTGLMFGYVLYLVLKNYEQKSLFEYVQIIVITSALPHMKSSAILLVCLLALVMLVDIFFTCKKRYHEKKISIRKLKKIDKKAAKSTSDAKAKINNCILLDFISIVVPFASYLSWTMFCKYSGLSGYLGKGLGQKISGFFAGTWLPPLDQLLQFLRNMTLGFLIEPGFDNVYSVFPNKTISGLFLCVSLIAAVALLTSFHYNSKKVFCFLIFDILIYILYLFGIAVFIFWEEFRNYTVAQCSLIFARYASPMFIGVFLVLLYNFTFPLNPEKVSLRESALQYISGHTLGRRILIGASIAIVFCMLADIPRCYQELVRVPDSNGYLDIIKKREGLYSNPHVLYRFSQAAENPRNTRVMYWGEPWIAGNLLTRLEMVPVSIYQELPDLIAEGVTERVAGLIESRAYTHLYWDGSETTYGSGARTEFEKTIKSMLLHPEEQLAQSCVYEIVMDAGMYKLVAVYQ